MTFVKIQKSKAYFKRYQVKYRRRREGKTDYCARWSLVIQDKNKYGTPRYRLVVRLTSRTVIAQVVHSEVAGDKVLAAAYSSELKDFGVQVGFKNYTSAYMTGYLVARRVLTKLNLAEAYKGTEEPDGIIHKSKGEGKREHFVAIDAEGVGVTDDRLGDSFVCALGKLGKAVGNSFSA